MTWQFALTGLLVGTLVGMTGMGGGSLMTPLLTLLWGVPPAIAIGTDIAHGAAFKTVSAFQHRRLGNVRATLAGWMLIGSAPSSLVGVYASSRIGHDDALARILGVALLFGAVGLVAKTVIHVKARAEAPLRNRDRFAAVLIGIAGGFIVGLTSVGSGVFFGLTLLVLFPLRAHKVVGTDILHAAALLYVAGIGHFLAGDVDLRIVGWLLVGSIPGALLGGRLSLSIPDRTLRLLLAAVLALSSVKLLDVPYTSEILAVGLAVIAALAITQLVRHRLLRGGGVLHEIDVRMRLGDGNRRAALRDR